MARVLEGFTAAGTVSYSNAIPYSLSVKKEPNYGANIKIKMRKQFVAKTLPLISLMNKYHNVLPLMPLMNTNDNGFVTKNKPLISLINAY
jgi:hypothetical protein